MTRPLQLQEGRPGIPTSAIQPVRSAMVSMRPEDWFVVFNRRSRPRLRLYCIPFAGGSATAYAGWTSALPDDVELRAVQLPGRQNRIQEPPYTDAGELASALAAVLAEDLADLDTVAYALFGHSMGALVAYEVALALRVRRLTQPSLLGVSARPAPQTIGPNAISMSQLSDQAFLSCVRHFGGLPDSLVRAPDLLKLVLPTLRADFAVAETPRVPAGARLTIPIAVFGGDADPSLTPAGLEGWAQLTTGPSPVRVYPGGHFYIQQAGHAVLDALLEDQRRVTTQSI